MIRHASLDDMDGLLAMAAAMHQESRFRDLDYDAQKMRELFSALIPHENGCVLVSEMDGQVMGVAVGGLAEDFFGRSVVAFEYFVYAVPAARGGLTGPRIVRAFLKWARDKGANHINMGITTGINTERTGALYQKLGGTLVGQLYSWGE